MQFNETLAFPAVTICNLNGILRRNIKCNASNKFDVDDTARDAYRLLAPDVQPSFHTADAVARSVLFSKLFALATVSDNRHCRSNSRSASRSRPSGSA